MQGLGLIFWLLLLLLLLVEIISYSSKYCIHLQPNSLQ
jgi:hypothetical protein